MKSILENLNKTTKGTLVEHLDIEFIECSMDKLVARMKVDNKTCRPGNIIHGGATMALAETVGSGLSFINADVENFNVFGIEINANHISTVAFGDYVDASATFIHKGKTTQVVAFVVKDSKGNDISVGRITNIIIPKSK